MFFCFLFFVFFFNDTATTEIYTLSLHDALPISVPRQSDFRTIGGRDETTYGRGRGDRKSTRLNSSHLGISYAVFCLKKKKKNTGQYFRQNRIENRTTISTWTTRNVSHQSHCAVV